VLVGLSPFAIVYRLRHHFLSSFISSVPVIDGNTYRKSTVNVVFLWQINLFRRTTTDSPQPQVWWSYRFPNGPPGPSPALARKSPALSGLALSGTATVSCRAVSGVVPDWRPRPGPMEVFSGRAGTTARLAHRAGADPSGSVGPSPAMAAIKRRR
jgi:hypothetical protein